MFYLPISCPSFLPLQSLLRTADYLKIKGLCELSEHRDDPGQFLYDTLGGYYSTPSLAKRSKVTEGIGSLTSNKVVTGSSTSGDLIEIDLTEKEGVKHKDTINDQPPDDDRLKEERTQSQVISNTSTPVKHNYEKMTSLGLGMGMVSEN